MSHATEAADGQEEMPQALRLLVSKRPRDLTWTGAAGLLFGDWGTSRLYVLGIAFALAGRSSFWLLIAMNLLILAVAWAYTQICRIYHNGGGVYTAARNRSKALGVLAALLLFSDYTITASLSAVEAFHYFGVEASHVDPAGEVRDAGPLLQDELPKPAPPTAATRAADDAGSAVVAADKLHKSHLPPWSYKSAAFWAILAILAIGGLNLLGPRHSAKVALFIAGSMVFVTLLILVFALPQIEWSKLPERIGTWHHPADSLWRSFAGIVLALSGVEAIASLTGVMKKPVKKTASKAIWVVAIEVAVLNMLLAVAMLAIFPLDRQAHQNDMLAYMAGHYVGPWGEWPVRILAGLLLLSATNTAIGALMGVLYVMSRDGEMPQFFQRLNPWGAPWTAAIVATVVPAGVLMMVSEVEGLAHLYAIGIVGAVTIDCVLCAIHPRLHGKRRKVPMLLLGLFLAAVWVTIAYVKPEAALFVGLITIVGFGLRFLTRWYAARQRKPSLLKQAIFEQLPGEALAKRRVMLATAGGSHLREQAVAYAKARDAALVVAFVRDVALDYRVGADAQDRLNLETDAAAQAMLVDFLDEGHKQDVPIIPAYDMGRNAPEILAELAAMNGVDAVLLGSSRRGALHRIVKGGFQQKLESLLPPGVHVNVLDAPAQPVAAS